MAKITKLPSGNWRTLVYMGKDENGKNVSISITAQTKDEVIVKMAELKKEKKLRKNGSMTVADAVRKYIDLSAPMLSPSTAARYEKMFQYGFPHLMNEKLTDLTSEACQVAINAECCRIGGKSHKRLSPKTVHNEWGLISSALKKQGYSYQVKLPRIPRQVEELPDPQTVFNLIAGTEIELPCLLAMWKGLRMSEIRGLDRASIHKDEIFIDKVLVDVDGVPVLKHLAKTDSSVRRAKMPPYLLQLIKDTEGYKKPSQTGDFRPIIPMSHNVIYGRFRRIMRRNGINITFHDLRHMYASISLNILQLPPKVVQVEGGWATPDVMNKIYSQSFSAVRIEADQKRDAFFENLHKNSHESP